MLRQQKSIQTILDNSNSSICASKDAVINQLNALADQLEAQIAAYNATDAAKLLAKNNAHQVCPRPECCSLLRVQHWTRPLIAAAHISLPIESSPPTRF